MRGRLSPERACWGMLRAHSEATKTGLGGVGRVYLGGPALAGSERIHWQVLAWRKGRGIQSFLPARSQIGAKFLHTYLVFEDGSSISPRVARVLLPANEADRPSCSSSVVSGVPNRKCCAR